MPTKWTLFPYAGEYSFDADSVRRHWKRLHAGDLEPLPEDERLLDGWAMFHNGEFQRAMDAGLKVGLSGLTLANKACAIYATYLEQKEKTRLDLYQEVARRAQAQAAEDPGNPNAWYWHAYALARYSQGISVAKGMAQGIGGKVKTSLERTIELEPRHADAHVALGSFHADVIGKVGALIAGITFGARKDVGLGLLQEALRINIQSVLAMVEYANALLMLDGEKQAKEASSLYRKAAAIEPMDAAERLDVEAAKAGLRA